MANMILHVDAVMELLKVADLENLTDFERQTAARFLARFPNNQTTLEKYRKKPGCGSCRSGMKSLIVDNPANVNAFLLELYQDEDKVTENFYLTKAEYEDYNRRKADAQKRKVDARVVNASGEMHDIDDTPEAYAGLLREIRRRKGRFAGLTVRELEPGKIRVYFY